MVGDEIALVPLTQVQLDAWLPTAIASYAAEHVRSGRWQREEALERSRQEHAKLLPEGVETPGQHLWSIVRAGTREPVGLLWVAVDEKPPQHAWVYNIQIDEPFRRKGYAEQAMRLLEREVRGLGLDTIQLHVFGHNHAALPLYEKLGYRATNVIMARTLDPEER